MTLKGRGTRIKDDGRVLAATNELPPFFDLTVEKVDLTDIPDPFARFVAFALIKTLLEPVVIKDPLLAVRQARVGGMYVAPVTVITVPEGLQVSTAPMKRAPMLLMLRKQQESALTRSCVKQPASSGRIGGNSRRRITYVTKRLALQGLTEADILHMRGVRLSAASSSTALEALQGEYPWLKPNTLRGIMSGDVYQQVIG